MTQLQALRATGIWFLFLGAAMVNGLLREKFLVNWLGEKFALPASGILLSTLIFLITYLSVSFIASTKQISYLAVGLLWATLTLSFEFIFGHYFLGNPWPEIIQTFNPSGGNLFVLVIIVTFLSPWTAAKIKNLVA